jgi:hypothetical protein
MSSYMRDELMERANRKALFEHIAARAIEVTVAPQPIRSLPVVYAADGGRVRSLTTSKFGVRRARRLERHRTHDTRHTTHDTRHATRDTRHTTHDTRHCRVLGHVCRVHWPSPMRSACLVVW